MQHDTLVFTSPLEFVLIVNAIWGGTDLNANDRCTCY